MENNVVRKSVLFLCTHNAVRSQMAEAFLNHLYGDRYSAFSAGSDPARIDPLVVMVMKEIGMDVSANQSKNVSVFQGRHFDYVVTVCDHVQESCPYFPEGNVRIHKSFPDPSRFQGSSDDKIKEFNRVRDEIKMWIEKEFNQAKK
ncbi:MAG: arsenate reductase ArsC [Syntrophaceae bacterium]|nr:arsenate reductase ArsC [Syntrophaceae bacterium]